MLVTTTRVGTGDDPHENLLRVDERSVRLVLVGGRPVLGTPSLLAAAGATDVEPLSVGGVRKGVVMRLPDELLPADPALHAEANLSWADGRAALQAVVDDPAAAVRAAWAARERRPRGAPVPLEFEPDMPGPDGTDGGRALTDDELDQLVVPPGPVPRPRRRLVRRRRHRPSPTPPSCAACRPLLTERSAPGRPARTGPVARQLGSAAVSGGRGGRRW